MIIYQNEYSKIRSLSSQFNRVLDREMNNSKFDQIIGESIQGDFQKKKHIQKSSEMNFKEKM